MEALIIYYFSIYEDFITSSRPSFQMKEAKHLLAALVVESRRKSIKESELLNQTSVSVKNEQGSTSGSDPKRACDSKLNKARNISNDETLRLGLSDDDDEPAIGCRSTPKSKASQVITLSDDDDDVDALETKNGPKTSKTKDVKPFKGKFTESFETNDSYSSD